MPAGVLQITRVSMAGGVFLNGYQDYKNSLMRMRGETAEKDNEKNHLKNVAVTGVIRIDDR